MISALNSALSALQAYGTKIQASSDNVANGNTDGYKRQRVILSTTEPGGVKALTDKSDNQGALIYEQTTNGLELIEKSNVDLSREFSEMVLNTHSYKANLKTLHTADELLDNVLNLRA